MTIATISLTRKIARSIKYSGSSRYCPICEKSSSKFLKQGYISPRPDVACPRCGSLERHRLFWQFLINKTDLFSRTDRRVLHIGAEAVITPKFRAAFGAGYLTADLYDPTAMEKMDITDIRYGDNQFDIIICSHVLEHVAEDRQAMQELLRVLKPSGWAILLVPISESAETYEDFSIVEPEKRLQAFGQEDHVRIYGRDFINRVQESGFSVQRFSPEDFNGAKEIERMALNAAAGDVFYCTKPQT